MKIDSLSCGACYCLFSLFDPAIFSFDAVAGTMITNESHAQGFAWRNGHVEFYTVETDSFNHTEFYGMYKIDLEIMLDEPILLDKSAVRALQVPFSVTGRDGIRICDDGDNVARPPRKIDIPPGDYVLVFEQGWKYNPQPIETNEATGDRSEIHYTLWGRLWFNPEKNAEPKILLQDPRDEFFNPIYPLRMDGVPLD